MAIVNSELRLIEIGRYNILALAVYIDNNTDPITGGDIADLLRLNYKGATITVSSTISLDYAGFDYIDPIDITDNGYRLVMDAEIRPATNRQYATGITLYKDDQMLGGAWFNPGYGGGDPWVEVQPFVIFVDSATGNLRKFPNDGFRPSWCLNNTLGNITVICQGNLYYWLVSNAIPLGGYTQATYPISDIIDLNIDDFSTIPPKDPYNPGGISGPGGGGGSFDDTSDPIDFPDLPTLSAIDTGLINIFHPNKARLQAFADYLWSDIDFNNWSKMFANPMDAVIGLSIVPVEVPDAGLKTVRLGNLFFTDITMHAAASQYVPVDCGTVDVEEHWGGYLDYDPYTKCEIYLPYIGTHPLAVDDIMGKTVHVKYHVDILSGACVAYVKCGDHILYNFIGQCSASVPISSGDMTNVINGVMQIAGSIGMMVATEGASIPVTIGAAANAASGLVNATKPNIEKSGAMGGTGGLMGIQKPYLILTRPNQCLPEYQNGFMGYPSFITRQLGALSGYTEVEKVHLEYIPATTEELSEIESLLKSGVIF